MYRHAHRRHAGEAEKSLRDKETSWLPGGGGEFGVFFMDLSPVRWIVGQQARDNYQKKRTYSI